jgi:hypothetical protein
MAPVIVPTEFVQTETFAPGKAVVKLGAVNVLGFQIVT